MTFEEKCRLVKIHAAINDAMGDTDPDCGDMTDAEIRQEEPLLWAGMSLAKMIGPGPWDKFFISNAELRSGIPHAPNDCSQSDTDRLVWLRRNISGLEMRRIGICMNDSSDTDEFRQRIDKAITATSRNTPPNIANVLAAQKATDNSTLRFGPEKQKGGERGGL